MNRLLIIFSVLVSSGILSPVLYGQENYPFVENKNQWPAIVLYKAEIPGGNLFLEKGGFVYDFGAVSYKNMSMAHRGPQVSDCKEPYRRHAYRVSFEGAQKNTTVIPVGKSHDYFNYFIGNDVSHHASYVYRYKQVGYKNLYPGIDMTAYTNENTLKYDFIIKPGALVSDIKMSIEGADNFAVKDNNLVIETSVGNITELKPLAFQNISGKKKDVNCKYVIKNNMVSFEFPEGFDKDHELVIDPTLVFSTYSGSLTDNWGFTATSDNYGNAYSAGVCFSTGFPVSMGSYQTNPAGSWDMGIIKYTPDGTARIFATFLGGSECEIPQSIVSNSSGDLIIFGTTGSSNFPVTAGAYDMLFNGGQSLTYDNVLQFPNGTDIYISKLSADGAHLIASTFVGGTGNDGMNFQNYYANFIMHGNDSLYYNYGDGARGEIITDDQNNIFVASTTFSVDFPVTPGAFQQINAGKQEGVVFKMSSDLSAISWCSYLGGSAKDAAYSIDIDMSGDVYVCGGTNSVDFPTTSGTFQPTFNGGSADGFVCRISGDGSSIISGSFFGSAQYDQVHFVRLDSDNNIYITGQTKAPGSTFIINATYGTPNSGQFIAKFPNDLSTPMWSTVFGTGIGKPNISITTFSVDVCNRICLAGWGREWGDYDGYTWASIQGTKNMEVTTDAFQSITDGQDFYLMVLADDASQLIYATFFGEQYTGTGFCGHDHVDGGTSKFNKQGNFYMSVCASCGYGCNGFPTFPNPGVWSPNNGGINYPSTWVCNNALFVFNIINDIVLAQAESVAPGCAPYSASFQNTGNGTSFFWDFGDGITSTNTSPVHTYDSIGNYNVMLIASDFTSCNFSDTMYFQVQVINEIIDTLPDMYCAPGDSVQIGFSSDSSISWSCIWTPQAGLNNDTITNPWATTLTDTFYHLVYTHENCTDNYYQQVYAHPVSSGSIAKQPGGIEIFPNPSTGKCSINFNFASDQKITLMIFDIQGKPISGFVPVNTVRGNSSVEVDMSGISSGVYWILASDGYNKTIGWQKLVVIH